LLKWEKIMKGTGKAAELLRKNEVDLLEKGIALYQQLKGGANTRSFGSFKKVEKREFK